ncbi:MAG: MauE/DoxX family redox-associated membrane protein [Pseudomonadota bacterium]
MNPDPLLQLVLSAGLALLMGSAALHKRREGARFQAQLEAYQLVPAHLLRPMAAGLPWIELTAGALMLFTATRGAGGLLTAALLFGYALAMLVNILRGLTDIDCGCGGPGQPLSRALVFRNLVLAGAAALLTLQPIARELGPGDVVGFAVLLVAVIVSYAALGQILRNAALFRAEAAHGN